MTESTKTRSGQGKRWTDPTSELLKIRSRGCLHAWAAPWTAGTTEHLLLTSWLRIWNFADDEVILRKFLEVLVLARKMLNEEAKPLVLQVSWGLDQNLSVWIYFGK